MKGVESGVKEDPEEINTHRCLLELDPQTWDPANLSDETAYIAQRLASKPVRRLTAAELRELIARDLSLPITVPLAMERIAEDPFLQAQRHPGDLITTIMESSARFWRAREDLWLEMIGILGKAVEIINARVEQEGGEAYLPWRLGDDFMAAVLHFRGIHQCEDQDERTV